MFLMRIPGPKRPSLQEVLITTMHLLTVQTESVAVFGLLVQIITATMKGPRTSYVPIPSVSQPPAAPREGDTMYRKNSKSVSYGRSSAGSLKKSLGSRNSAGLISKSLRDRERDRISGHGAFTDSNGWQVYPASRYDTLPRGPIKVSKIEMAPAYAYNPEKGELCLLPNFDRVIVTEDGKRIREAVLAKGNSLPNILHDVDVKSITGSTRSLSDLVSSTMGPLDLKDQRASSASIEEERKEQQFSEMQFEQVRMEII